MFGINSQIGGLLHNDHVNTIAALQRLEAYLLQQTAKKVPAKDDATAQKILKEIIKIAEDEVGRHFGFEEGHLFPELAAAGEVGMTQFLMSEHASILPVATELAAMAKKALESGFSESEWKHFHELGMEMVEREIFHIQKEEMGLLAAIGALLDQEADSRLAMIFGTFTGK